MKTPKRTNLLIVERVAYALLFVLCIVAVIIYARNSKVDEAQLPQIEHQAEAAMQAVEKSKPDTTITTKKQKKKKTKAKQNTSKQTNKKHQPKERRPADSPHNHPVPSDF